MTVEDPVKVIRYGRHEFTIHEAEADGDVYAGDVVEEQNGGDTVTQADSMTQYDRLCIAIDDRERGKELGDSYADGTLVQYIRPSGGAFNVLMASGQTVDPDTEDRIVVDSNGKVRPFDADGDEDVLFTVEADEEIEAPADEVEPIPVVVV